MFHVLQEVAQGFGYLLQSAHTPISLLLWLTWKDKPGPDLLYVQQLAIGSGKVRTRDTGGILMVGFLLPPHCLCSCRNQLQH